jgi:hypothetical protein
VAARGARAMSVGYVAEARPEYICEISIDFGFTNTLSLKRIPALPAIPANDIFSDFQGCHRRLKGKDRGRKMKDQGNFNAGTTAGSAGIGPGKYTDKLGQSCTGIDAYTYLWKVWNGGPGWQ